MAVAAGDVLLVHAPKTGGTWAKAALRALRGDYQIVGGGHDPLEDLEPGWREGRRAAGTVRDPWSWYVSWYYHCMDGNDAIRRALACYGGGRTAWREVLYGVTHPTPGRVPTEIGGIYSLRSPEDLIASGGGLASHTLRTIYRGVDVYLDQAQLAEQVALLCDRPVAELAGVRRCNELRHRSHTYARPPDDHRRLYDDESSGWVAAADAWLIDSFGYRPWGRATRGVLALEVA